MNCPKCKEPYQPQASETKAAGITQEQLSRANFMKGRGCNHCRQTGYRGRQGIFEMMRMTSLIRELTFAQAPTQEIRRKARSSGGLRNLLEDGVMKVLKGVTTLDEVLSTCHAEVLVAQEG
jgi:type IV pilus assembly protein PilB